MSAQCMPLDELLTRSKAEKLSLSKPGSTLPTWLRSKPRSKQKLNEALAYCELMGYPTNPPPWEDEEVR